MNPKKANVTITKVIRRINTVKATTANKQERTVICIGETDAETGNVITVYYYAYISDTPAYRKLHVDSSHPLSEDEVEEFFRNEENKIQDN